MGSKRLHTNAEKVSVTLPPDLVRFAEDFQLAHGLSSRSEVLARALQLLQEQELREAYRAASQEWEGSKDQALWEGTSKDGLDDSKW